MISEIKTEDIDPIEYVESQRSHFNLKANKNKRILNNLMALVILSSVFTPVFILISGNFFISKLVPSVLGAIAAFSTYWIQLKKPQEKWILFRTAQRQIEYEIDQYRFGNRSETDKNQLALRVSRYALEVHKNWVPLVPSEQEIRSTKKT